MKKIQECPCFSGLRYHACCRPLHLREYEANAPVVLMRSRFSAFALGLGGYLVDTLSHDHADRTLSRLDLERELSHTRDTRRFLGLRIGHCDQNEVLFFARIFERGQDVSFAELSTFVKENAGWRYASGIMVPGHLLPKTDLTRDEFITVAGQSASH